MLKDSEIKAILFLLDDPDEEVVAAVEERLYSEGPEIISTLESFWKGDEDPVLAYRIETIIKNIQNRELEKDFTNWLQSENQDLLEGCLLICRIQYPGMNPDVVHNYIEKVRIDAWMALYSAGNPMDRVKILNHILFERHGLKGNQSNYHSPDNSFLNRVIESRTGNPITLCCLYSIIAQKVGMPVFGVNLPQHFVLAWCEEPIPNFQTAYQGPPALFRKDFGKILFYINPFSHGQIFLKKNIDEFLDAIKVAPQKSFYEPCNNLEIIKRMLRNLHFSYTEIQNNEKRDAVANYMKLLGMGGEMNEGEGDNSEE
ncbi:MAG: transglutaminase family protein [Bacteroidia bacterium]|nr:transglutaminase family protein [Bacteroidia bacterium]